MLQPSEYYEAIAREAAANGIGREMPMRVAHQESGIRQFNREGSVLRGKAGELGIFQILPSSAPGVDLNDPAKNIAAGVAMLAHLYRSFGNWPAAVAAYNYGEARTKAALSAGRSLPPLVSQYVRAVTGEALTGGAVPAVEARAPQAPQNFSAQAAPSGAGSPGAWTLGLIAAGVLIWILATR